VTGLGDGLYEVRTDVNHDIYRVMFCILESTLVRLNACSEPDDRDRHGAVVRGAVAKLALAMWTGACTELQRDWCESLTEGTVPQVQTTRSSVLTPSVVAAKARIA
jgi:hypothetical protein